MGSELTTTGESVNLVCVNPSSSPSLGVATASMSPPLKKLCYAIEIESLSVL